MGSISPTTYSATPTRLQTITATGTGFTAGSVAKAAPSYVWPTTYVSPTQLTFNVQTTSGAAGSANVYIDNAGQASGTKPLTWTA